MCRHDYVHSGTSWLIASGAGNEIGGEGAKELAETLKVNQSIEKLFLESVLRLSLPLSSCF